MNTAEFSRRIGVMPQSIRARLCNFGSYYSVKPTRLPNGQLLWPDDAAEKLQAQCHDADRVASERSERALAKRRANAEGKASVAAPAASQSLGADMTIASRGVPTGGQL